MCYMQKVGIRELRQNATAVLRRVAAGEVVEVQLQAEGRASDTTGDLLDVKSMPRIAGRPSLSKILADMRADER